MEKTERKELILNGDIYKVIMTLSLPIMLNNFIQTLYNLADAIWVSKLGSVQFAATSFVWPIIFLFISLGIGISIAGTSILSQLIGASKYEEADEYASQLIVVSFLFSIGFTTLGYILSPYIIKLMGGTGAFAGYSDIYLKISFLGFPFVFLFFNFNSIMHAQGNTMAPTIISGVSAIINVILDPIFIFTLDMGVAGAAIATVISQALLVVVGIYILKKHSPMINLNFRGFKFNKEKLTKIMEIGLPSTLGQSGEALGFTVLNSFIASYGTATLAAFGMVNRITSILIQPPMGMGAALTSIAGQNIGGDQLDRAEEAFKKSIKLALIIGTIGATFMLWKDKWIINLFIRSKDDQKVIVESITYLRYISLSMPLMGMFSIFQGLFQGSGHTKYSMSMDIGRLWLVRLPMILIFKHFTDLGSTGIWLSMSFSNLIVCLYGFIIYRIGYWKDKVVGANIKV